MKRLITLVAFSALVVGSVASTARAADLTAPDARWQAYQNSDQWRQDHSADDLNRAAVPRAIGTVTTYGSSGTGPSYTGSGYTGTTYTGTSSTTTTTTTTISPAIR